MTDAIPFNKGPLSSKEVEERSSLATKMGLETVMQVGYFPMREGEAAPLDPAPEKPFGNVIRTVRVRACVRVPSSLVPQLNKHTFTCTGHRRHNHSLTPQTPLCYLQQEQKALKIGVTEFVTFALLTASITVLLLNAGGGRIGGCRAMDPYAGLPADLVANCSGQTKQ